MLFKKHWMIQIKAKQSPKDAKQTKNGLIKDANFTVIHLKNGLKIMILRCIQYIMNENLLLLKDLLELLKSINT